MEPWEYRLQFEKATDELAALRAENERLASELEAQTLSANEIVARLHGEKTALRAENERLREQDAQKLILPSRMELLCRIDKATYELMVVVEEMYRLGESAGNQKMFRDWIGKLNTISEALARNITINPSKEKPLRCP